MKDLYEGQFHNSDSLINKLDVRFKLYFLIIYACLCMLSVKVSQIAICALYGAFIFLVSRQKTRDVYGNVKNVTIMILFLAVFKLIFERNVIAAAVLFARLFLIAFMSAVFILTTKPRDILMGMEKGFHIKSEYAMSIAVAFTFLPMLSREMRQIKLAQAARGADISSGNIYRRLKNSVSVIVPLFEITIDKSGKMAEAMDIRCYNSENERTSVRELRYRGLDLLCAILMLFVVIGVYLAGVLL